MTYSKTSQILDEASGLGYTPKVDWRIQPTRKAYALKKRAIGVGWLDGMEFEGALLFDPHDEGAELVEMLARHGVTVRYDGEIVEAR